MIATIKNAKRSKIPPEQQCTKEGIEKDDSPSPLSSPPPPSTPPLYRNDITIDDETEVDCKPCGFGMDLLAACLPCLTRWRRDRDDNPERQRLFPPPDTILTPPRPRRPLAPIHAGHPPPTTVSAPISPWQPSSGLPPQPSAGMYRGWSTPSLGHASRERIGSISRAYQGRMLPLSRSSQPTTPYLHSHFSPPGHSAGSSTAPTPIAQDSNPHDSIIPRDSRGGGSNLGRSVSEPQSLSLLAKTLDQHAAFAPHQLPRRSNQHNGPHEQGGYGEEILGNGGTILPSGLVPRGRPRSATTVERLSPLHSRDGSTSEGSTWREDVRQGLSTMSMKGESGKSPGPSALGRSVSVEQAMSRMAIEGDTGLGREGLGDRSGRGQETHEGHEGHESHESHDSHEDYESDEDHKAQEGSVTRRNLGLRDLDEGGSVRRRRGGRRRHGRGKRGGNTG